MIDLTEKFINLKIKKKDLQEKILLAKDQEELEKLVEQYKEITSSIKLVKSAIKAGESEDEELDLPATENEPESVEETIEEVAEETVEEVEAELEEEQENEDIKHLQQQIDALKIAIEQRQTEDQTQYIAIIDELKVQIEDLNVKYLQEVELNENLKLEKEKLMLDLQNVQEELNVQTENACNSAKMADQIAKLHEEVDILTQQLDVEKEKNANSIDLVAYCELERQLVETKHELDVKTEICDQKIDQETYDALADELENAKAELLNVSAELEAVKADLEAQVKAGENKVEKECYEAIVVENEKMKDDIAGMVDVALYAELESKLALAENEVKTITEKCESMVEAEKLIDAENEIEKLKAELENAHKTISELSQQPNVSMSEEELLAKIEYLKERLRANEKEFKQAKKEFLPLNKIRKNLENDKKKLRRKEAIVAKQKVVLYGVNNITDIDQDKAQKLQEELDLLDGLRLSVAHCEEVMSANKERLPLLEKNYNLLLAENTNIKNDIKSCEQAIENLKAQN